MGNNFKCGWYEVGGKRHWFRSGFEVRWAKYLEFLISLGEIVDWKYEPRKFEFEGIRSGTVFYIPDFKVAYPPEVLKEIDDWSLDVCPKCGGCGDAYAEDSSIACGKCGGHGAIPYLWHECKGYLQQKDVTKMRRMAKYYPLERTILVMQRIPSLDSKGRDARRTRLLLQRAEKYVERIMDGTKTLKKAGL